MKRKRWGQRKRWVSPLVGHAPEFIANPARYMCMMVDVRINEAIRKKEDAKCIDPRYVTGHLWNGKPYHSALPDSETAFLLDELIC